MVCLTHGRTLTAQIGSSDTDADPDHDGATNLEEYLAGTTPPVRAKPGQSWYPRRAALYKNSLQAPTWSKLSNVDTRSTNRTVVVWDPTPVLTNRFDRLVTPQWP